MDVTQPAAGLIDQVMVDAKVDLTDHASSKFTPGQVKLILAEARRRLSESGKLSDYNNARTAWKEIVYDFHRNQHWGFGDVEVPPEPLPVKTETPLVKTGRSFLIRLFITMVITKTALLFAGSYYSSFPGEGYGYWLIAAVVYTLVSLGYLVWSHRNLDL